MTVTNEQLALKIDGFMSVLKNGGVCKAHSGFDAHIGSIEKAHDECKAERTEAEKGIVKNRVDIREIKTKFAIFVIGGTIAGNLIVNAIFKWAL